MTALTMRLVRGAGGEVRHVPTPFVPTVSAKPKKTPATVPDPIRTNGESAAEQLRLFIERLENLRAERAEISTEIADVEAEAKATGYDIKGIRAILALRRKEKHVRDEDAEILALYQEHLGL